VALQTEADMMLSAKNGIDLIPFDFSFYIFVIYCHQLFIGTIFLIITIP